MNTQLNYKSAPLPINKISWCRFLFVFGLVFLSNQISAQIHISSGTAFIIKENTIVAITLGDESQRTDEKKTIVFLTSSDTKFTNSEQFLTAGKLTKKSTHEQKEAKNHPIAKKETPPKKIVKTQNLKFQPSPANEFILNLAYNKYTLAPVSQQQYKAFTAVTTSLAQPLIPASKKTCLNGNNTFWRKKSLYSQIYFARPPPLLV